MKVFPLNSILVGTYRVGDQWNRYKYFKVKNYSETGNPKIVQLKNTVISGHWMPYFEKTHTMNKKEKEIGTILPTYWDDINNSYFVSLNIYGQKQDLSLEPYISETIYKEKTYN